MRRRSAATAKSSGIVEGSPFSAANARTFSPISFAPRATIDPTTMTVREATVGPESGTLLVQGVSNAIRSIGTRAASAAIWRKTVSVPWPMSVERRADAEPTPRLEVDPHLPFELSLARSGETRAVEEHARADPAPRPRPRRPFPRVLGALPGRIRSPRARAMTHSSTPTLSRSDLPVTVVEPTVIARARLKASGSSPSFAARRSMCRSIAQIVCGAPKPRNAPFGGVFVATAIPSMLRVLPAVGPGGVEDAARDRTSGVSVT